MINMYIILIVIIIHHDGIYETNVCRLQITNSIIIKAIQSLEFSKTKWMIVCNDRKVQNKQHKYKDVADKSLIINGKISETIISSRALRFKYQIFWWIYCKPLSTRKYAYNLYIVSLDLVYKKISTNISLCHYVIYKYI